MMMRQGKRMIQVVAVVVLAGMIWFSGCEQETPPAPLPATPKVVSKPIDPSASIPVAAAPSAQPQPKAGQSLPPAAAPTAGTDTVAGPGPGPAPAMPSSPSQPVTEDQVKKEQDGARTLAAGPLFKTDQPYDTQGRVDPFIPLLTEKPSAAPEPAQASEAPKRIMTPLEKMDLSQIKLVAIIQAGTRTLAMVEEASGKGYEVRVGTYMGRSGGRVTAIHGDGLTITETYTDYQGKRRERAQEIKFHKNEGGE